MQHEDPVSPEVVAAVMRHMNEDHAADALVICRALGEQPQAASARMAGMDQHGIDFVATVAGRDVPIHLPWYEPLTERAQIRGEVTRMYRDSCVALGIAVAQSDASTSHS